MSKRLVPPELSRKVSPGLLVFVGASGTFMKVFGIGMAAFGLYGTILSHPGERPHHSALLYFLGPWLFPSAVAVCYLFSPFRPYRGVVYVERTQDIDTSDTSVMRLVGLLRSKEARHELWRGALLISALLFALMSAFAILLKPQLSWSVSPADLGGVALGLIGSFIALSSIYIGWGLTTWAKSELKDRNSPEI